MHRRDKSNSETATHICISLRLSLLYAYVCARKRVCVCASQCVSVCLCMCVCTHWRSRVRVHACVDPCAFASTVPSHFPSVITRRCGRGRQNSRTRSLAHTHTGAKNSLKLEGGKHIPRTRQSPAPPATGPLSLSLSRNISASSLTAKHHRDATEAERSPNRTTTLPQPLLPH